MKHIYALCSLFAASILGCHAQNSVEIEKYFTQTLQGNTEAVAPSKNISIKKIGGESARIWEAWKQANADYDEEKLPQSYSAGKAVKGMWNIPADLEPNAKLNFFWLAKDEKPENGYPLFVYLHGSGPRDYEWNTGLKLALYFKDSPSLYFIPQIPNEGEWYRWYQKSKQYALNRLLRQALLRTDVNADRIYFFGISEGAYGSQRLASFYADYLAAAGPMAGGEPLKNAPVENLGNIGFSLRTGAEDKGFYRDILTRYTREALDSMQALHPAEYKHNIELIPGYGHQINYSPTTPWLSKFIRNACPKHFIWEDFEMDGMHRTGFYNILVEKRPATDLRTRYDVNIHDNIVDVTVRNIHYKTIQKDTNWGIEMKFSREYVNAENGSFILFLNDKLVDLSEPVTINVNGKTVASKKRKASTGAMLRSVAAFYDPMRIYPVQVEIRY